jgi:hypothetical protein
MENTSVTAYQNITEFCILFRISTNSSNSIGNTSSSTTPKLHHIGQLFSTNLYVKNAQMTNPQSRYAQEYIYCEINDFHSSTNCQELFYNFAINYKVGHFSSNYWSGTAINPSRNWPDIQGSTDMGARA